MKKLTSWVLKVLEKKLFLGQKVSGIFQSEGQQIFPVIFNLRIRRDFYHAKFLQFSLINLNILPKFSESYPIKSECDHNVIFKIFFTLIIANSH